MFNPYCEWTEGMTKLSDVTGREGKESQELTGKNCKDLSYRDLQNLCHELLEDKDLLKKKLESSEITRKILKGKLDESDKTVQALTLKNGKLENKVNSLNIELLKKETENVQLRQNLLDSKLKDNENVQGDENKAFDKIQGSPLHTLKLVWDTISPAENPKLPGLDTMKLSGHPPSYDLVKEEGQPHDRTFTMVCKFGELEECGEGKSKKLASRQAAYKMLDRVKVAMDGKENCNIYGKDLKLLKKSSVDCPGDNLN